MNQAFKVRQALGLVAVLGTEADKNLVEQRMSVRYGVLVSFYRACKGTTNQYCLRSQFVKIAELSEEEADDVLGYWTDLGMIVYMGTWNGKKVVKPRSNGAGEDVFRMSGQGIDLAEELLVEIENKDPFNLGGAESSGDKDGPLLENSKLPLA